MVKTSKMAQLPIMGTVVGCIALLFMLISIIIFSIMKAQDDSDQLAKKLGTDYAINKCRQEGLDDTVCSSVSSKVSQAEHEGHLAWIVDIVSSDGHSFSGDVILQEQAGQMKVVDYSRSKISQ